MSDPVDKALQELAAFAAASWSNNAIVDGIEAVRELYKSEMAEVEKRERVAADMLRCWESIKAP